jgi:very-short-patch-repair endonuclease
MTEEVPRSLLRRFARQQRAPSHDVLEQRLADEVRDVWLRDQGFRVLRLPNELVVASTELAVARIGDAMTN